MRVFVAINPPDEVRMRIGEAERELREAGFPIRWVPAENVHLTLKFLGEVPEERLRDVYEVVNAAVKGIDVFDMAVSGLGAFPSLRRPNVVWLGVELDSVLSSLQVRTEENLGQLGFPREDRPFRPHLTLGRARKRVESSEFRGLEDIVRRIEYSDSFRVGTVDIMSSRLMPTGAIHDVIHTAELGARM